MPTGINKSVNLFIAIKASKWTATLWVNWRLGFSMFQTCSTKEKWITLLTTNFRRGWLKIYYISSSWAFIVSLISFSFELSAFYITPFVLIFLFSWLDLSYCIFNFFAFCWHWSSIGSPIILCLFDLRRFQNFLFT